MANVALLRLQLTSHHASRYRKAHRVDPNVELRAHEYRSEMYERTRGAAAGAGAAAGDSGGGGGDEPDTPDDHRHTRITDIHAHMRQLPFEWQYSAQTSGSSAGVLIRATGGAPAPPAVRGSAPPARFGSLPPELIVRILVLLFERTFDVARLMRVGEVCRAFFKVLQDEELWRQVGKRVWRDGPRGPAAPPLSAQWGSVRHMCIARPKVLVHGIYITRYQYHRMGERKWDEFYTPQLTVTYYRYIRFWPDGSAVLVTSADRPEVRLRCRALLFLRAALPHLAHALLASLEASCLG
jgi:hypothetical protein